MDLSVPQGAGISKAERIIKRVFRDYRGNLAVRLWDGQTLRFGDGPPAFTLVFRDPRVLRDLILFQDPLRLADAYFCNRIDIDGDLFDAFRLKDYFQSISLSWREKLALIADTLALRPEFGYHAGPTRTLRRSPLRRALGLHSRDTDREAIAFHYDVSNAFYQLWLDEQMVYSCAYFQTPEQDLDAAQRHKLDHICRKLRLKPGERLLDIGCGWGALIRWAANHYGVKAHGITLSRRQYDHGLRKIAEDGLEGQVSVEIKDYRDLPGENNYDKVVSVGMFEHVGLKNLPVYFGMAHRQLKPGGLFLNHGITHFTEGWTKTLSTRFINRYVFPDGELDTVSNVGREMERAQFEIHDIEGLRPHYALTLRHWVQRLEARKGEALKHVTDTVYRIWRLYMAACAVEFDSGGIGIYQILASKGDRGRSPVPLTRADLY